MDDFDENFEDLTPNKKRKQKKDPYSIEVFPEKSNWPHSMKYINSSQNHSCGVSTNGKVFIWGHNNVNNKLGL
jgi:alpha-tubulin suppressor-like RCC1 family protein